MEFKVIRTREQYQAYLDEVHSLIMQNPAIGSPESDRLELLSVLIEDYENKQYPIEAPDPIDAILFRMHEKGLKQADLAPYFGTTSRVSEVLNRKKSFNRRYDPSIICRVGTVGRDINWFIKFKRIH